MDARYLASADFWEDEGCFVAGEFEGVLPELGRCVLFRTSGSTGTGEGRWVVLKKKALLVSARAVNEWLEVEGGSVWGLALPLNHVGGFSIAARVYVAGCGMEIFEGKWNPEGFVEWLGEGKVTHLSLVPTQVHDLVKGGVRGPDSLVVVVVGGGSLSPEMGQGARELGWPVLASYGMTETCSQVATQKPELLGSPYAGQPLEILPIWRASVSKRGVLRLKGEALFAGRLLMKRGRWIFEERGDKRFKTNDRVKLRGRTLMPLGRADSLVKVMGELVDLEEVERAFFECAGGGLERDSFAVVNLRNERRENELIAVFEWGGGREREYVSVYQKQAPGIARLGRWINIGELPRTGLGKLRRGRLREMVSEVFNGGAGG